MVISCGRHHPEFEPPTLFLGLWQLGQQPIDLRAPLPDLSREPAACLRGCLVDDQACLVVSAARMLSDGPDVLRKRHRSTAGGGVVLPGPAASPGPAHGRCHARVAALTEPPEIGRSVVPLFAVPVINFPEAG